MVTDPGLLPVVVGTNVASIAQFEPGRTLVPHVFDCEKSPLATILEIARGPSPVLDRVTLSKVLVVPTSCGPNVSFEFERAAMGTTPLPNKEIRWGLPASFVRT